MKKILIALILTCCMAGLSACNVNVNVNNNKDTAAEKTEDVSDASEDSTETEDAGEDSDVRTLMADADGVLSVGMFSLTMPKDTEGSYIAFATDNSISICDKASNEDGFGGYVFSVEAYGEPDDYAGGLGIKKGEIHTGDSIYDVIVTEATDVEWDYEKYQEMPDSYAKIYGHMNDIVDSLKPSDGGEYIPGAGTTGEELYGDVIAQFKKAISEKWDASKLEKNGMSSMYYAITQYEGAPDAMKVTGYAFRDLNSDGIDELVVGEIAEGDMKGVIYDIYTMVDRKPAHVISGYARDRYYDLPGGVLVNEASGGAELTEVKSYYLTPNTTELLLQIGVKYDSYDDKDNPWYVTFGTDEGKWEKITEDEYNEYLGRINDFVRFDYTPFDS